MQNNKNRKGLALGAVLAMIASAFVMTAPAQAVTIESSAVVFPTNGTSAQTTMLSGEAYDISFRMGTSLAAAYSDYTDGVVGEAGYGVNITKPAGVTISAQLVDGSELGGTFMTTSLSSAVETAGTTAQFNFASSGSPKLALSLASRTSQSAAVSITVTPFLDLNRDGTQNGGEANGTPMTITFVPWSALGATVAVETPTQGDIGASSSFALSGINDALNWSMLDNFFVVSMSYSLDTSDGAVATATASMNISGSASLSGTAATDGIVMLFDVATGAGTYAAGFSGSYTIVTSAFAGSETIDAGLYYGNILLATSTQVTVGERVAGTSMSSVVSSNLSMDEAGQGTARVNSAWVINAYPWSASITTSVEVATVLTVSSAANLEFDADSGIIVNGVNFTQSAAFMAALINIPATQNTVAVSTYGQTGDAEIVFDLNASMRTSQWGVFITGAAQTASYTPTTIAGLSGAAKTLTVSALDQWGVASVRTDQRVAASVVLGGSTSTTVSGTVVNGVASVTVTPVPATRTGSAVVYFQLQTLNQATQEWANTGTTDDAAWNIYTYASGTDTFTSRTVSVSASVSYGVNLSWSATVAIGVKNSFSDVVVSAPGLMIQNADETTATASDTLTIAANGQTANLKFTSRLVGTYTVTFTSGTATTTSLVVFGVAEGDTGATLTFDKTSIAGGTTTTITGTLKDVNGNPVKTSGSADVNVAWSGKGLPFGNTATMETDDNGQLKFYVLVLSGEVGDAAIAATYQPTGLTVSTLNVAVVQAVAVGKAAATAAADQKVNVGSFKGFVALYAKGYAGQKMTAIVAGKWIKVDALASNFERVVRYTGAGYTITTKIYIDGVLKGTFSTVTK